MVSVWLAEEADNVCFVKASILVFLLLIYWGVFFAPHHVQAAFITVLVVAFVTWAK